MAVAVAVYFSCLWAGSALGPLITGTVGDIFNDLGTGLLVAAFGPLTLSTSGVILALIGRRPEAEPPTHASVSASRFYP